jgi:hypothetical protein
VKGASGVVLVLALESDLHADSVVHHLTEAGVRVERIDPTVDVSLPRTVRIRFGADCQAEFEFASGQSVRSNEVSGVLCRFAVERLMPADSTPLQQFSRSEEIAAFLAPLRMIESRRWINDPWLEARADCRILQAQQARAAGLRVPPFIVSSRYADLADFNAAQKGGCIIKPISDAPLAQVNHAFADPSRLATDRFNAPYTAAFTTLDRESLADLDLTPSLIQARVRKQFDIRATVVDGQVFSAAMPVMEGAPVDFRRSADIPAAQPFALPEETKRSLVTLVAALHIRFASCDLVVDQDGEIHFLESNVSGNWLWTELEARLPVSRTIAEGLLNPPLGA